LQSAKKRTIRFNNNKSFQTDDDIIIEEPLVITVNGERAYFCMRLPGMDRELAAGVLYNDGVIDGADDIKSISSDENVVHVEISGNTPSEVKKIYSSTGSIFSSELLMPLNPPRDFSLTVEDIFRMKEDFLSRQKFFEVTGGTHCASLFNYEFENIAFAEDVGRHNALDKCTGNALLQGRLNEASLVLLSSRLSLEMIKKSCRTGALLVAGFSAPTSAAVDAAEKSGITLIGFLREGRFNVYSIPQRIKDLRA